MCLFITGRKLVQLLIVTKVFVSYKGICQEGEPFDKIVRYNLKKKKIYFKYKKINVPRPKQCL